MAKDKTGMVKVETTKNLRKRSFSASAAAWGRLRAFACAVLFLAALSLSGSPAAAAPLFEDNFDLLDTTVWAVSDNGYPAPAADVSGGAIHMGRPGVSSLDFPYVRSQTSLFPASGDFSISIGFRYTSIAGKGDGLQVLDSSNTALFAFWQDSASGLRVGPAGVYALANTLAPHVIEFQIIGGTVTTLFDGSALGSAALASRPDTLWFGHPSIGQVINTQTSAIFPGLVKVDANGVVVDRWWAGGPWTTFDIDFIRVQALTAVPEPGALSLLGVGLLALGIARRRAGRRPSA